MQYDKTLLEFELRTEKERMREWQPIGRAALEEKIREQGLPSSVIHVAMLVEQDASPVFNRHLPAEPQDHLTAWEMAGAPFVPAIRYDDRELRPRQICFEALLLMICKEKEQYRQIAQRLDRRAQWGWRERVGAMFTSRTPPLMRETLPGDMDRRNSAVEVLLFAERMSREVVRAIHDFVFRVTALCATDIEQWEWDRLAAAMDSAGYLLHDEIGRRLRLFSGPEIITLRQRLEKECSPKGGNVFLASRWMALAQRRQLLEEAGHAPGDGSAGPAGPTL